VKVKLSCYRHAGDRGRGTVAPTEALPLSGDKERKYSSYSLDGVSGQCHPDRVSPPEKDPGTH
jgi:hypothetical protein